MNKIFKISLAIVLYASAYACSNENTEKKTSETAQDKKLRYATIMPHHLSENVQLPGVLQPFEFIDIYPKVNGFVKDVYVDRGSTVHAGEVLMELEAPELQANVAAAKLKYTEAIALYHASKDRYERLLETSHTPGTVSAYDLTAARSKMMADSATVQGELASFKAQEAMNDYLTVKAPFDGVITERDIHPGALVGPGSQNNGKPMLVLQQQSKLRLVINLPEQFSTQVNNGDWVKFKVNALPGEEFKGRISRSSGALSDRFRSETVEIDVPNPEHTFKAGMYAEVIVPLKGDQYGFDVPKTAVITTTEHKYVLAVRDNKLTRLDVTQGNETKDSTEVFGRLQYGDIIVANATYDIPEGQHVDVGPELSNLQKTTKTAGSKKEM